MIVYEVHALLVARHMVPFAHPMLRSSDGAVRVVGFLGLEVLLRYCGCILQNNRNRESTCAGALSSFALYFTTDLLLSGGKDRRTMQNRQVGYDP